MRRFRSMMDPADIDGLCLFDVMDVPDNATFERREQSQREELGASLSATAMFSVSEHHPPARRLALDVPAVVSSI